ncbi:MAG TPA: CheR family methyltransferase [Salinivirgaceae bacterium]|nr:CheR family methyltransferase [Salinivirgaceae bacterium]HQA75756.1 CheR family methyltransferase [Salinivirgaceae bacterium]
MIHDIGIVDTKKIIAAINDTYNIDFSGYALTSFKRRILKVINENNYSSVADFINRVETEPKLFEKFLSEGLVDTTEMFRDPSFWRDLRDVYLPELIKVHSNIKVLIPGISSADDVYSLMILLKESNLQDKVKVLATSLSQLRLDDLDGKMSYDVRKMENSEGNYKRFTEDTEISNYYTTESNKVIMDSTLLKGVETKKHNFVQDDPIPGHHLILYRNRMIYLNATTQDRVCQTLFDSLVVGGIFCIGSKENIDGSPISRKLTCLNPLEKIYKKRNV